MPKNFILGQDHLTRVGTNIKQFQIPWKCTKPTHELLHHIVTGTPSNVNYNNQNILNLCTLFHISWKFNKQNQEHINEHYLMNITSQKY